MYRIVTLCSVALLFASAQGVFAAEDDPLVAWWTFDEGSGEIAADSSGNGLDGTITDANWVTPGWNSEGTCLELAGEGYVDLGNPDALNFGTGDWTVAAWVQTTLTGSGDENKGTIYANGGDWGGGIRYTLCVGESSEGLITLTCDDDATKVQATGTTLVNDGEWHLVVGMREGEAVRVYVDGQEDAQGQVAASYDLSGTSQHNAYIGVITDHRDASFKKPYRGLIDDVRVFSLALREDHIQDLYQGIAPNFEKAGIPEPADGLKTVEVGLFRWSPGANAFFHEVYLGTSPDLTEDDLVMPQSPMTLYFHQGVLEPGQTYYWRVDEIQSDGTETEGDVWSFMTRDVTSYAPSPADGAMDASTMPTLTWLAGQGAVNHQLYLSDTFADVNEAAATADRGIVEGTAYEPNELEPLTAYYWRADGILLGGDVTTGPVWDFTTYRLVDDFEVYDANMEAGTAVFLTWFDGFEEPTNGSQAGYLDPQNGTYNETRDAYVYSGGQSMPVDYNNTGEALYSEVERSWTLTEDWTDGEPATLVLHVLGRRDNDAAPLYVALTDSGGRSHAVVHEDPEVMTQGDWMTWTIPLSAFADAGVNLGRIASMAIGIGDPDGTSASGATGLIYVDDIYLTK